MSGAAPDAGPRAGPNLAEAVRGLRREPGAALGAAAAVALSGAAGLPVLSLVRDASLDPPGVASALRPTLDLGGLEAASLPWSGAAVPPVELALEGWEGLLGVLAAVAVLVVLASAVAAWSLLTGRTLAECECSKGGGYVPVVAGPLRHAVVGAPASSGPGGRRCWPAGPSATTTGGGIGGSRW